MASRTIARYALGIIVAVNLLLVLAGCAQEPTLVPVVVPRAPVTVPAITPLTLDPVNWQVLNADLLAAKAAELRKTGGVVFALDQTSYQSLSIDLIQIQRYLRDQAAVIELLKSVTDPVPASKTSTTTPDTPTIDSAHPSALVPITAKSNSIPQ